MMLEVPTMQGSSPLMQFSAGVGDSRACVRIRSSRLEWSLVGRQWVIQMAPIASISAISFEPGLSQSNLFVTTALGVADFCVEPEIAEQARTLLMRLVAMATARPDVVAEMPSAGSCGSGVDELINLKWMVDAHDADSLEYFYEPARLLGL
jgi:hypothetical protein